MVRESRKGESNVNSEGKLPRRDAGSNNGFFVHFVFLISIKTHDHDNLNRSDDGSKSDPHCRF